MDIPKKDERLPRAHSIARYVCLFLVLPATLELGLQIHNLGMTGLMMRLVIITGLLILANEPRLLCLRFSTLLSDEGEPRNRLGHLLSFVMAACVIVLLVSSCQQAM